MSLDIIRTIETLINFVILFLVMRHFLFKPVTNVIASRESEVKDRIEETIQNQEEAKKLKTQYTDELKKAKDEGKGIVEDYKVKAQKMSQEIVDNANKQAQDIMEKGRSEVLREKEKANDEIRQHIVELAVLLSTKALDQEIDEDSHRKLINDFIAKVGM